MKKRYVVGINSVKTALEKQAKVTHVWVDRNKNTQRISGLLDLFAMKNLSVEYTEKLALDLRVPNVKHQGVIIEVVDMLQDGISLDDILSKPRAFILMIDGVQDPHNLGACLRSAAAVGVDAVIIPKNQSATINATVSKVAAGATEMIPIFSVNNLSRVLEKAQSLGHWSLSLTGHTEHSIYSMDLKDVSIVIVGNENKGVSHGVLQKSDYLGKIPMKNQMESLNVSVATGISLFEVARQKQ